MENKNHLIYKATGPSGKVYIGLTSHSLEERSKEHIWLSKSGKVRIFQMALKKYNYDFKWEIIEEGLDKKEAEIVEKYYIAFFNSADRQFGYNQSPGGFAGNIMSEEGRTRWQEKMKKHWEDPKFQRKLSEGQKKRFQTEDVWNKGKVTSIEVIEKLRISHLGKQSRLGHKIQFCPQGHDTFVVGREKSSGQCKQCRRKTPIQSQI